MTITAATGAKEKRGSILNGAVLTIVLMAALVHGWLVVQYNTAAPCQAAAERLTGIAMPRFLDDMDRELAGNPFGGIAKAVAPSIMNSMKPMAVEALRRQGLPVCYGAASACSIRPTLI